MTNPTRSEVIKKFLESKTLSDLAKLYSLNMECQVNVGQDGGERISQEFKGRNWHGFTDGLQTWKSFRIPYKANTFPEYTDVPMSFDLAIHAEGIGLTGWDWKAKVSKWFAFDFDSLFGHSSGLTDTQLENIKNKACEIPWVTVRRSTSGKGIHLYVFINDEPTINHTQHAALARSILGIMSGLTGFNFSSKIDVCGGNMWIWHRKMKGTNGLQIIKKAERKITELPTNWRDHIPVITTSQKKIRPQFIKEDDVFTQLTSTEHIPLDKEHQRLIDYLNGNECLWSWDSDNHMMVTHTIYLKDAYEALSLKGIFTTNATGKDRGNDQNCFLFPKRNGAWQIRRFTQGVSEASSWDQDGSGWTRCYFNQQPDLRIAARQHDGIEDTDGKFIFPHAENALRSATLLGVNLDIPGWANDRKASLSKHKDGRLIIEFDRTEVDNHPDVRGWLPKKKSWQRIINASVLTNTEPDTENFDELIRHIVTSNGIDQGWMLNSNGIWRQEPLNHIQSALAALGHSAKDIKIIAGSSIFKCWTIINRPFEDEYQGDRKWNKNAAQFRYAPLSETEGLQYGSWLKILDHIGASLNSAILTNPWARANGLKTGADYLKCWIASLFQEPMEPLPYLFLYGPQASGKSIFHEALSLLVSAGVKRADHALTSQSGFNGELKNAVICIVEETNLKKNNVAYNRIKDWVTSPMLPIHEKGMTPYMIPNSSHWIQCSNEHDAVPVFAGDTRITMIHVPEIDPLALIPKKRFFQDLVKEAPAFLTEVINLELPNSPDRLNIPILITADKKQAEQQNKSELKIFIERNCHRVKGQWIKFSDFYDRFIETIDSSDQQFWTKNRLTKDFPPEFPQGRCKQTNHKYLANISWEELADGAEYYVDERGTLRNE